ncbi:NAD(P)-binding protein [Xylariomycetidae sp. FL2044]|nr:NAD(P)-binding protein [Xylariomycetidae sp. FL2044]
MNYTKTQHTQPYAAISPAQPHLSAASRTVFIVGGSSGIGRATAQAFLEAGCTRLALTGRHGDALAGTAGAFRSAFPGARILTFAADVVDAPATDAALAGLKAELGSPADVVVNCASYLPGLKPLAESDPAGDWWTGFEVNVKGAAILARAAAAHASPDCVVLQLSTAGALMPAARGLPMSGYAASKLAAVKVMEYFGAENPRMRVLSVHPGIVAGTDLGRKMVRETGMDWPSDNIALPARFLVWAASDEAAFLKNKFVFAGWDVDELKARKDEIAGSPELILGLNGFPRNA